jgi:hypothetical protein
VTLDPGYVSSSYQQHCYDPGIYRSKISASAEHCRCYWHHCLKTGYIMRDFSEKTVRPVSEHFYDKNPEDVIFYMSRHEKDEAIVDENISSGVEKTDATPVYDSKPKFYQPCNDEEKAIDKKLNFKLDFIVIVICAINFVVCYGIILNQNYHSNNHIASRH